MRASLRRLTEYVTAHPLAAVVYVALFAALCTAGIGWYALQKPSPRTVAVTEGPLTETVSVSGTVKAARAADLSIQIPGRVTSVPVAVGTRVGAGQMLLSTDAADLSANLAQAQAALQVQQAKLASLQDGTQPEQLALDQTAVTQDQAALRNAVQSVYVYADDAIHAKADQLFTNPRTENPTLAFSVSDAALVNRIQQGRTVFEPLLSGLQAALLAPGFSESDPVPTADTAKVDLTRIVAFLDELSSALTEAPVGSSFSGTAQAADEASINVARLNVAAALTSLTSAETALAAAEGALVLAQAGATPQDITAQQAQVAVAEAAVSSARAALGKSALFAPFPGTVTSVNAHTGDALSPSVPVISMISDAAYQVEAYVSEADVAKIVPGEAASVTLDSDPSGAPLEAVVGSVDLSATMRSGVAAYKVVAVLSGNDPRVKAGLTGNLTITSKKISSALQVPASAILQEGTGPVVLKESAGGSFAATPVMLGAAGAGMVEILSGVSLGDRVQTFGASL